MKLLLCLFAAALVLPASSHDETLRAAIDKFAVAAKAGDESALRMLLADDLTYVHSSAKLENKAEAIAAMVKTKPTYMQSDIKVRIVGNTAIVNMKMTAMPANTKLDLLQVWVKKGANWQMAARQATRLP